MSDEIDRLNDRMNGIFREIQKLREREDEQAKRDCAESEDEARAKRRLQEHVSMMAAGQSRRPASGLGSASSDIYHSVPQSDAQNNATQNRPLGLHDWPVNSASYPADVAPNNAVRHLYDDLSILRAKLRNYECQLLYIENWIMNPESARPGAPVSQSWILGVLDRAKKQWPVGGV